LDYLDVKATSKVKKLLKPIWCTLKFNGWSYVATLSGQIKALAVWPESKYDDEISDQLFVATRKSFFKKTLKKMFHRSKLNCQHYEEQQHDKKL
jgi:hypothetical protein